MMLSSLALVAVLIVLAEMKLPLPENEKGIKELEANIESCEIDSLGRSSDDRYYIHIYLNTIDSKKISHNFQGVKKSFYVNLCKNKSAVNVKYHAVRTLLRPKISYWLNELNEK